LGSSRAAFFSLPFRFFEPTFRRDGGLTLGKLKTFPHIDTPNCLTPPSLMRCEASRSSPFLYPLLLLDELRRFLDIRSSIPHSSSCFFLSDPPPEYLRYVVAIRHARVFSFAQNSHGLFLHEYLNGVPVDFPRQLLPLSPPGASTSPCVFPRVRPRTSFFSFHIICRERNVSVLRGPLFFPCPAYDLRTLALLPLLAHGVHVPAMSL